MPISEIALLNPYQAKHIVLRPKEDDSSEKHFMRSRIEKEPISTDLPTQWEEPYQKVFYEYHATNGRVREEIDGLWKEYKMKNE